MGVFGTRWDPWCALSVTSVPKSDTGIPLWDNWVPLMGLWVTLGPSVPPKCDLRSQDPPIGDPGPFHGVFRAPWAPQCLLCVTSVPKSDTGIPCGTIGCL